MDARERAQLKVALSQALTLVAQLRALLEEADTQEEAEQKCPRCGGDDLAEAGDVLVCAGCNANIRDGEVVAG